MISSKLKLNTSITVTYSKMYTFNAYCNIYNKTSIVLSKIPCFKHSFFKSYTKYSFITIYFFTQNTILKGEVNTQPIITMILYILYTAIKLGMR